MNQETNVFQKARKIARVALFAGLVAGVGAIKTQAAVITVTSGSVVGVNSNNGTASELEIQNFSCNKGDVVMILESNNTLAGGEGPNPVESVSSSSPYLTGWSKLVTGLTYFAQVADPNQTQYSNTTVEVWDSVASQAVSNQTITVDMQSGANSFAIESAAYHGLASSSIVDKVGSFTSGTGSNISASVTPTATVHTITFMLATAPEAPATFTPGIGYLQGQFEGAGDDYCNGFLEYSTTASSGNTVTPTVTWSPGPTAWRARAFTLKLAS